MNKILPASAWKPDTPGIFAGLPMETYLSAPGASRSLLRRVAERPSTCLDKSESTEAMRWGTLLNDLVLFGTRNFYTRPDSYLSTPKPTKAAPKPEPEEKPWSGNSNTCKQWLKEHADKPVLSAMGQHSALWLERAETACLANPRVRELLKLCAPQDTDHGLGTAGLLGAEREVTLFARSEEYHFLLKSRPDLLALFDDGRVIYADIKTTTDASTHGFAREILKYGYHKQAALARQILHKLGHSPFVGYFIIVEKGDKPRVQVRKIAERALDKGDLDLDDEMQIYQRCRLSGEWPDFADEPERHITGVIDLPEHCYKGEIDGLSGMTEEPAETADAR